ncbi:CRISPR-associated protein Cas1 [Pelistega indica]|uniref:CRISPR-associated endonuclease Cas1 n=1 Tax=Pelistega indica TaxID=1414851 RepID=V8FS52_9BURK|nr:CRISPR-associated endonuclease Cas1 [Pelistega indica]ETD67129.1 CRISPR-associated protein Cas1 [Pelistega indica]
MSTLCIDRRGLSLRTEGKALIFYDENRRVGTIPIHSLERVCIYGELQLSASVLGKLGEQGVGILVLNGYKKEPVMLMPNQHVDAKRRQVQYVLANQLSFSLKQAQKWIIKKLQEQLKFIHYLGEHSTLSVLDVNKFTSLVHNSQESINIADNIDSIRGFEGAVAAQYFQLLAKVLPDSLGFSGRNRRPPKDPFNAVLSLGYTLLYFEAVRQCYLAGLDAYSGFYHTVYTGRASLACDLIEPVRALYDQWLREQFVQRNLRLEDFSFKEEACVMGKAGRARFYEEYEEVAKKSRKIMRELLRELLQDMRLFSQCEDSSIFELPDIYSIEDKNEVDY